MKILVYTVYTVRTTQYQPNLRSGDSNLSSIATL